jgi:hypothetical protein
MRRDKTDRAIKSVHWKIPKYLWKRCDHCKDDVKGEQMWWFKQYYNFPYNHMCMKMWTCRRCAPLMSDLFKLHAKYFIDVDLTCIEEEERQGLLQRQQWDKQQEENLRADV